MNIQENIRKFKKSRNIFETSRNIFEHSRQILGKQRNTIGQYRNVLGKNTKHVNIYVFSVLSLNFEVDGLVVKDFKVDGLVLRLMNLFISRRSASLGKKSENTKQNPIV